MAARVLFTANQTLISRISTTITPSSILPLIPVAASLHQAAPVVNNIRVLHTYQNGSLVMSADSIRSTPPPKKKIWLDGCDFELWLVVVDTPEDLPTRDALIYSYINILAKVVGSYDEARMKIYSVSIRGYYAFGARVSSDDSLKLQAIPGVRRVLPDSYVDVENKDYGGEPFIDGKAVPYDAKYHEEFDRNNAIARAKTMNRNRSLVMSSHSIRSKPSPKKKIWLDGCDFEHWLVVVKKPEGIPGVLRVLPDSYMDVENKDYGVTSRVVNEPSSSSSSARLEFTELKLGSVRA
ncbi:multiple organellar RNA editing factor 8, chloroplastic/mitochondrial-like [Rutidosis leptorrhynchoides]|uniref:multiple organellar RNA editing factor 8, chloroplastic/mitochondrial-like n=1 Tax=Rutidosis leptorrhynchoides TaxID=125765 RepID=UPI003A9A2481